MNPIFMVTSAEGMLPAKDGGRQASGPALTPSPRLSENRATSRNARIGRGDHGAAVTPPEPTMDRRTFLGHAGLGASALLASGAWTPAHADKPINFSGWVFKPDTVKDYVNFYNQKYGGQVKYESIPWAQYHPTMETRAFAGEIVDVMYCNHNNRERWFENGLIRAVDDLPGADELKKKMTPANLDSMKSKDGTKLLGLPYFTSLFVLMYNEPMLKQAGIAAPAKSWDELVEHCTKLKRDKVSDTPFLPNWNNSPSGTMPQLMTDCFSEGAQVFDAKNRLIVDQEPGAAKALDRWQKVYKANLVNPEVLTKTSSTDTHRLMWTGRYAYHTNHSYYLKTIAGEPENSKLAPKKARMTMYPGTDLHVDRLLRGERQVEGPRRRVEVHQVPRRQPERRLVRAAAVVPDLGPRQPLSRDVRPPGDREVV
jgi:multiple sugar transport system substrate-binding protein